MSILKLVSKNLLRRKGRFIFTLLGITIGMGAFVALFSIGGNMQSEVTNQAGALGGDFLIVPDDLCVFNQIGIITGDALPEAIDYEEFENVRGIEDLEIIPLLTRRILIYNPTAEAEQQTTVSGILPELTQSFRDWTMYDGEYFSYDDQEAIIIGQGIMNRFQLSVGSELEVRPGETFTVIGVLNDTNSNDDTTVHMPLSVAQRVFDREGTITYMAAKFTNVEDMARFDDFYAKIHNVANNINVTTNEQLLGRVLSILDSVNVTLRLVAGVALIAAAFGIINTMMTAVYERRREIGILQALGGKANAIFKIFVLESGLYGLLGGLLGVGVGTLAAIIAAPLIAGENQSMLMGMELGATLDVQLVVMTVVFSLVISVLSGLYPAWKASRLTPIEAIR